MLHIKFDQDWPTGYRDIQVWMCGRRRTDDGPLVYFKLTLWAFSSGELIILKYLDMQVQANSEEPDRLSEQLRSVTLFAIPSASGQTTPFKCKG